MKKMKLSKKKFNLIISFYCALSIPYKFAFEVFKKGRKSYNNK